MNDIQYRLHEIGLDIQRDGTIPDALKSPLDAKILALWEEAGNPPLELQRKFPRLHESGLIKRAQRVWDEAKGGSHGSATDS